MLAPEALVLIMLIAARAPRRSAPISSIVQTDLLLGGAGNATLRNTTADLLRTTV